MNFSSQRFIIGIVNFFSQRFIIGILSPILFELTLLFLYATLRYQNITSEVVLGGFILFFFIVIFYVGSPYLIVWLGRLQPRLEHIIARGLYNVLILHDGEGSKDLTYSTLSMELSVNSVEREAIYESLKENLVPNIAKSTTIYYIESFQFRREDSSIQRELLNLEYYESLALFSGYTFLFMILNLVLVLIMKVTSINILFVVLDYIENYGLFFILLLFFGLLIAGSIVIFRISMRKIENFLPYTIPILFQETELTSYIRKEQIRSIVAYDLDELIERRQQRKITELYKDKLDELVGPLIAQELLIESRKRLGLKLAWREYRKILDSKAEFKAKTGRNTTIDRLLLGEKFGKLEIDEAELLALNSDLSYVRNQLTNWRNLDQDQQTVAFLVMYRMTEHLIRESTAVFADLESTSLNFFEMTKLLLDNQCLSEKGYSGINEFRFLRNKLIHEPGTALNASSATIAGVITALNELIHNIQRVSGGEELA